MRDKGFTLLEIIIALTLLSMAYLILLGLQSRSFLLAGRAERLTQANFLAATKMGEVQIELEKEIAGGFFPDDKSESGNFDEPFEAYKWSWQIRKVELPIPETKAGEGSPMAMIFGAVAKQISDQVRELKLKIGWEELGKEKSIDVVTHWVKL